MMWRDLRIEHRNLHPRGGSGRAHSAMAMVSTVTMTSCTAKNGRVTVVMVLDDHAEDVEYGTDRLTFPRKDAEKRLALRFRRGG